MEVRASIIRIDKIRTCAVDQRWRTRKSSSEHNGRVAAELIQVEHVGTRAGNGASLQATKRPTELFLAQQTSFPRFRDPRLSTEPINNLFLSYVKIDSMLYICSSSRLILFIVQNYH